MSSVNPTAPPESSESSAPSASPSGPPAGLATALTVLLALATLAGLAGLFADYRAYEAVSAFIDGGATQATLEGFASADRLGSVTASAQAFVELPTAVVFLVWFHRVRVNAAVFAPDGFARGTRWAVGCWFIPIGQLWLPFKTATEIWGASAQAAPDGSWRRVSYGPVLAWWATWTGSKLLSFAANRLAGSDSVTGLRTSATVSLTADLLFLASGVLAVRFVRTLTAMQHAKATQGPNALV
ncbi:DUF4328 domain-containing protein [Streptomyces sp. NBC_00536]|uniref:DUF4328 domain-containing protein n=1 Tax=Streptomyces sp. NBC_00536 TaxID=2975769 RepID=UPI002E8235AF|nr:DUF4328 domain-containing protein [Streptomyces sp. NBC_00536]WUC77567.1 DUF4328 domain-containing protein [Streptomyces sp. NBC_00536]